MPPASEAMTLPYLEEGHTRRIRHPLHYIPLQVGNVPVQTHKTHFMQKVKSPIFGRWKYLFTVPGLKPCEWFLLNQVIHHISGFEYPN